VHNFDLDTFLPYQLADLSSRISAEFSTLYQQKYGISPAEWRVVANLAKSGSVSVREIHNHVDMDKSKVSRAAARLERAGYVSKMPHHADRRLVELPLTAKGRAMVDDIAPLAVQFEAEVLRALGSEAEPFRAAVGRLLERPGGC